MAVISPFVEMVQAEPATVSQIRAVHTVPHVESVKAQGVYHVAALAAGGAIQAATIWLLEPCMGIIRPPGHHATADSACGGMGEWGRTSDYKFICHSKFV